MIEAGGGFKPDLLVVARILERLWSHREPMVKTRLQVSSGIKYDLFARYLEWLLGRGLVNLQPNDDGHERVVITRRGFDAYAQLIAWLDEFVRGDGGSPPLAS